VGSIRRTEQSAPALKRAPVVTVYHAEGCHLCERVLAQVRELRQELDFELREVDIGGDEALEAEYREWIPVIEIDGRRRFTYYLQPDAFRVAVAQAAAQS
jgi:glutaredoxin